MSIKNKFQKGWSYIVVFLIPWILIIVHSVLRGSWLSGEGSILAGDAGSIYYELYTQLWDKVHEGGSLFFTWNAGLGMDFLTELFQYLMSPFTLLILLVPRNMISNALQFTMVLKWSLTAVTMLYYLLHTKKNALQERKMLISIALTLVYSLSNAVISGIANPAWLDVMILFPFLLLLVEKMTEGTGFKRFYLVALLALICNYVVAIPALLFLCVWFGMQYSAVDKKNKRYIYQYIYCVMAVLFSSLLLVIPCVVVNLDYDGMLTGQHVMEYVKSWKMSLGEFVQHFFLCDSLLLSQQMQPMLYCGVVVVAIAILYLFIPTARSEKITCIVLALLLCMGFLTGGVSLLWYGYVGNVSERAGYVFLLTFLLLYMTLQVLTRLEALKKWNVLVSMIVCVGAIVYGFFKANPFLDFYVYLATFLVCVLMLLLLFFYCRKSILYKNILVVFSLLCMGELIANAYYQLAEYNMYPIESSYYNQQSEVLAHSVDQEQGERVLGAQTVPDYGMVLKVPGVGAQSQQLNHKMLNFMKNMGESYTEDSYNGATTLLSQFILNCSKGMSESDVAFASEEKSGENNGYALFDSKQQTGLGYVVSDQVNEWNAQGEDPFEVQNDFIRKTVDGEPVFEVIMPEMSCESVMGKDPEHPEAQHEHHEDGEEEEEVFHGMYDKDTQTFEYSYTKMYEGDCVKLQFTADGSTDYYAFTTSDCKAYYAVLFDEETVYTDQISSYQKMLHIGKVDKGTKVTIEINAIADVDTSDVWSVSCKMAAFSRENYAAAYDKLSDNLYKVDQMTDTMVTGTVDASESGTLVMSIPALKGFDVMVDGTKADCKRIGDAFIGIPVTEGQHTVSFEYRTPGVNAGLVMSILGIFMMAGFCFYENKGRVRKEETV